MAARFVPLTTYRSYPEAEMLERAASSREEIARQRTMRDYGDRPGSLP
jgi:iodotyrosine deiodinase